MAAWMAADLFQSSMRGIWGGSVAAGTIVLGFMTSIVSHWCLGTKSSLKVLCSWAPEPVQDDPLQHSDGLAIGTADKDPQLKAVSNPTEVMKMMQIMQEQLQEQREQTKILMRMLGSQSPGTSPRTTPCTLQRSPPPPQGSPARTYSAQCLQSQGDDPLIDLILSTPASGASPRTSLRTSLRLPQASHTSAYPAQYIHSQRVV